MNMEKILALIVVILLGAALYYWNDARDLRVTNQLFIDMVRSGTPVLTIDGIKYNRAK